MAVDESTIALARKMTAADFAARFNHRTFRHGDEVCVFHEGTTYRWRVDWAKKVHYYGWAAGKLTEGDIVEPVTTWNFKARHAKRKAEAEE